MSNIEILLLVSNMVLMALVVYILSSLSRKQPVQNKPVINIPDNITINLLSNPAPDPIAAANAKAIMEYNQRVDAENNKNASEVEKSKKDIMTSVSEVISEITGVKL